MNSRKAVGLWEASQRLAKELDLKLELENGGGSFRIYRGTKCIIGMGNILCVFWYLYGLKDAKEA